MYEFYQVILLCQFYVKPYCVFIHSQLPEITDISPKLGPVAGGTNVTLIGDNLHLGDNIMVRLNGTIGPATVIK